MTPQGSRAARRLPQLARHPQPRGRRGRALPREDGAGTRRPRRRVTIFCAAHAGRARRRGRRRDPLRASRVEDHRLPCRACSALAGRRLGHVDLVVDVQNGLPFFTRMLTRKPVVVLVHHVHREQWPVVYPGLVGQVGWWIEHAVSPRASTALASTSRCPGHPRRAGRPSGHRDRIAVVHNGTDPVVPTTTSRVGPPHRRGRRPAGPAQAGRARHRRLGRGCARRSPASGSRRGVRLVGGRAARPRRGPCRPAAIELRGTRDEERKHEVYEASWVLALPSLKEGWGLVVGEAGMHRHADGRLPLGRWDPRVHRGRAVRAAGGRLR